MTQEITDEFRSAEKGLRKMAQGNHRTESSRAADAKTRQTVQTAVRVAGEGFCILAGELLTLLKA